MRLARVFPTKTSMSPDDEHAYFGPPGLFTPEYDEIHVSVTFTWDIPHAEWLAKQWKDHGVVKIGGPAIDGEGEEFVPGKYLREGVTITSRGCSNRCPWCVVEHPVKELAIQPGNIVQDNNLLACSNNHILKVFQMLRKQKQIELSGGLEPSRITRPIAEGLSRLNINQLFIAYDHPSRRQDVLNAVLILKNFFTVRKIRCYVLIGYGDDTPEKAEERLLDSYSIGVIPFAMLYRNPLGEYPDPEDEWRKLQKTWARPASIAAVTKERQDWECHRGWD